MKQDVKYAVMAALVVACCGSAQAADSVDVLVTGRIVPSACSITVNGGSEYTFDYGKINRESLSGRPFAALPKKTASLSITCNASTQVAIRSRDGRDGSNSFTDYDWEENVLGRLKGGLGWSNGKPIGAYSMSILPGSVDGVQSHLIWRVAPAPWAADLDEQGALINAGSEFGDIEVSWATTEELVPVAGKIFNGTIVVEPVIDTTKLDTSDGVTLDGQSTIEIVYL